MGELQRQKEGCNASLSRANEALEDAQRALGELEAERDADLGQLRDRARALEKELEDARENLAERERALIDQARCSLESVNDEAKQRLDQAEGEKTRLESEAVKLRSELEEEREAQNQESELEEEREAQNQESELEEERSRLADALVQVNISMSHLASICGFLACFWANGCLAAFLWERCVLLLTESLRADQGLRGRDAEGSSVAAGYKRTTQRLRGSV